MLIGENPLGELPGIGDSFSTKTKEIFPIEAWIIFAGSEPIEGGGIRWSIDRKIYAAIQKTVIQQSPGLGTPGIPFRVSISNTTNYTRLMMELGIKDTLRYADMSMLLVPSYESTVPSTSVLNALVWTWAETFDAVWRQTEEIATSLKLETASGTDLDEAWGRIYDMPRIYLEDDTRYRDRLKTRTSVLTSSGTIANCEAIIDSLLGENSTTVESVYPASVRIRFDTDSAMRTARSKQTLLASLIPQMLAAGITYNMYLPFAEYNIDAYIRGPAFLPYNGYCTIRMRDIDSPYTFDMVSMFQPYVAITSDVAVSRHNTALLDISANASKFVEKSLLCGYGATKTCTQVMDALSYIKKYDADASISVDFFTKRYDNELSHDMDALCKKQRTKFYYPHVTVVSSNDKNHTMNILTRDPRAVYLMKPIVKFQMCTDPSNFYVALATLDNASTMTTSMRLV
jgi:hypothetical protein